MFGCAPTNQNLNFLTNDLCRLGVKSQKHRLSREDVVQLQTLVDNLKTLTKSALAQTRREEDFEEELPSQSSYSLSSSPPSSTTSPTQPLGPGFLSSTISALSIKNPHLACTLPHSSFKRRNRGRNFPRDIKRECTICKTDKTSQWRSGADGRPTCVSPNSPQHQAEIYSGVSETK